MSRAARRQLATTMIGIVLLGWWVYVYTYVVVAPNVVPILRWLPRERFLNQEFCEFKARQLRRDGLEAICWYVDD